MCAVKPAGPAKAPGSSQPVGALPEAAAVALLCAPFSGLFPAL